MSKDVAKLIGQIRNTLDEIAHLLREEESDTVWTREIKQRLVDLGNVKGFYTCASGGRGYGIERARWGEWLWDVCWIQNAKVHGYFMAEYVPFACESEWGNEGDIVDDFQKLLCADIGLGLMIFQCRWREQVPEYLNLCRQAKDIFYNGSERKIVLACYCNESQQFYCVYLGP